MKKRIFDLLLAIFGLIIFGWVVVVGWFVASLSTKSNGFFIQERIGRHAKPFRLIKLKTMLVDKSGNRSSIAVTSLGSITRVGRCLRRFKIDELPQLFNVLIGDMSFVGPRPDVSGYADFLNGHDRLILELRPGITGPASIKYKNEEEILMGQEDPVDYNNNVIWPDKVAINLKYYHERTLKGDIKLILETIFH